MLIFLRMPLFFFVSGLFGYRVVTATCFRALMRDKVTNFVYLYLLWESHPLPLSSAWSPTTSGAIPRSMGCGC